MRKFLIEINIVKNGGILATTDLPALLDRVHDLVEDHASDIVIFSGRLPVWAFAALTHEAALSVSVNKVSAPAGIAIYDPRLRGYVIVYSHLSTTPKIGTVLSMEYDESAVVNF